MPRVSVIIPCFNASSYLGEAIRSVLSQTFTDFEIIIVDDGSTDNTPEIVKSFSDRRIHYLYQENQGLSAARNAGIRTSDGEYMAFLDADDWFLPDKLAVQTQFLDDHLTVGCVASGWIEADEHGKAFRNVEPWHWKPDLGLAACVLGVPLVPNCVLIRRAWLDVVGLFDVTQRYREDWDLWLQLAASGCKISWHPSIVCQYRVRPNSMARNWRSTRDFGQTALDKIYRRVNLAEDVQALQSQAYAALHTDAAVRAYGAGDLVEGCQEVIKAIQYYPYLLEGRPAAVVRHLVAWMDNLLVGNPNHYLQVLASNLPPEIPAPRTQVRLAVSSRYMDQAFSAYQNGRYSTALEWLRRSTWLNPRWLMNRGVLSMAFRAIVRQVRQPGEAGNQDG